MPDGLSPPSSHYYTILHRCCGVVALHGHTVLAKLGYWSWEGFLLSLYILYQQISASCNQDEVMRGDLSKILIDLLWSLPSVTIPVTIVVTVAPGWVKWDVTNISSALSYGMHWSSPDTQYLYIYLPLRNWHPPDQLHGPIPLQPVGFCVQRNWAADRPNPTNADTDQCMVRNASFWHINDSTTHTWQVWGMWKGTQRHRPTAINLNRELIY